MIDTLPENVVLYENSLLLNWKKLIIGLIVILRMEILKQTKLSLQPMDS